MCAGERSWWHDAVSSRGGDTQDADRTVDEVRLLGTAGTVMALAFTQLKEYRFSSIFAAAGHPNAVFEINFENLIALTSGEIKEITEWDNLN